MKTLCDIMNYHGSDKSSLNNGHGYTLVYERLFEPYIYKNINLLEIGIGPTYHIYKSGASLRGWREYFPNSNIFGCDINKELLFFEERINTFLFDQRDPDIDKYFNEINTKTFDIIIDDGLHETAINVKVLIQLFKRLNPGGYYIIEDIFQNACFDALLSIVPAMFENCTCSVVKLKPTLESNSNLFILHKR